MDQRAPNPVTGIRNAAGTFATILTTILATLPAGTSSAGTVTDADSRLSHSRQYADGGRESGSPTTVTDDRYAALVISGERSKSARASANGKPSGPSAAEATVSDDFWIYAADVRLFDDDDRDGYYHGIDLLFDADTIYEEADVYAVLYLSYEGGPWNEYATTDTFRIFGATSDDEYVVVTELESGYPRGNYDLVIDLYDTFDGSFVATLGPEDTSALGYLPLEDFNRDDPDRGGSVVVVDGGGGAADAWTILAALLYLLTVRAVGAVGAGGSARSARIGKAFCLTSSGSIPQHPVAGREAG